MRRRNLGVFGIAFAATFTTIMLLNYALSTIVVQFALGLMVNSIMAGGTLYMVKLVRSKLTVRMSLPYLALSMFVLSSAFFALPIFFGDSDILGYTRLVFLALGALIATSGFMTGTRKKMTQAMKS